MLIPRRQAITRQRMHLWPVGMTLATPPREMPIPASAPVQVARSSSQSPISRSTKEMLRAPCAWMPSWWEPSARGPQSMFPVMSMSCASSLTLSASLIPPFVRPSPWMSRMRSIASVPSPSQPSRRSTTGPTVSTNVVNFAVTLSGSVPPTSRATCSSGCGASPLVVGDDRAPSRARSRSCRRGRTDPSVRVSSSEPRRLGVGRVRLLPLACGVGLARPVVSQVDERPGSEAGDKGDEDDEGCECLLHERVTRRGASRAARQKRYRKPG